MWVLKLFMIFGFIVCSWGRYNNDHFNGLNKNISQDYTTNKKLDTHLRNYSDLFGRVQTTDLKRQCNCVGPKCKCCAELRVKNLNMRQKVCSRIIYDQDKRTLDLSLIHNDRKLVGKESSEKDEGFNFNAVCVPLPLPEPLDNLVKLCGVIHDVKLVKGLNIQFCLKMETRILDSDTPILVFDFKCYTVGMDGTHFKPER